MGQSTVPLLTGWVNFYVILGSSAGALTGLQFVVMTLIAQLRVPGTHHEIRAFGTPTVVHFCCALLVSAIMSAPWHALSYLSYCLGTCAAAGFLYSLSIIRHARKGAYNPDAEDWFWYAVLPVTAYLVLGAAAVLLSWHPVWSLFIVAAITFMFLVLGIHNSWDTVTYVALKRHGKPEDAGPGVPSH